MNYSLQLTRFFGDTHESIARVTPELWLVGTIAALLLSRCLFGRQANAFYIALAGALAALWCAAPWNHLGDARQEIFSGLLVYDGWGVFVRSLLLLFLVLFILFTRLSGIPDRDDGPDIYTLVFGSTLGLCFMATSNHLFMTFMAVEMASVPSYALAGMLKGRRLSSEAALKYSIFGAGTAGVMLYGISLLAGLLNTAHLPSMAAALAAKLSAGPIPASEQMVLALGGLMLAVGLAFKLSAVPFHFWCPDVFEGAAAEVNAFLSVASKTAALALLVRIALGFGVVAAPAHTVAMVQTGGESPALLSVADEVHKEPAHTPTPAPVGERTASQSNAALAPVREFMARFIALLAVITCTFGNLAAYAQSNIKRMFAYSTIAHAGYMMMAVPAVLELASSQPEAAERAVAALGIYLGVYLFLNLGAFVIVAFLRNALRSEEIESYAGLVRRLPLVTVCLAIILFGLVGLPPLSGFIGKFAIFASLVEAFQATGQAYLLALLLVGGLNTAVSLYYYLRVAKIMTIDPEPADRVPFTFSDVSLHGAFVWAVAAPSVILFFFWDWLNVWASTATSSLLG